MHYRDEPSGITFRDGDAGPRERFQTLANAIDDGIYQLDAGGRFVAVNDAIVEETGYDTDELLGEHVSVIFDAEEVARLERQIERLRTSAVERSEPLELAVETASSERIYWELRVSLVGGSEAFHGTIGVAREITDRKQQEREHQRVVQALNAARDGISLLDDGEFAYVNDTYAETFGYDPDEMVGEHWESLGIEANPDRFHEEVLPTVAEEGQWSGTTTCVRRDGSTFLAEHSLTDTEDGELICVVRDVTEQRERERELREKERRYEAIFEDPNILVGLLEPDGTVLDINQTAMDYIDADLEAVTGELFWETPWWGEGDELQSEVREWVDRAASGEYVDFEADLTSPDGEEYVIEGMFRPVTNDDGEVVSVIVSGRDITERIQRERALEESEQRYRTLAEYFPNGVVTLFDHDLTYTLAAGQGFDRLPFDPTEVEGAHFREVWDDETAEALGPLFQAVLDGRERSVEVSYADREWVIHGVPITDERGEVFAGMTMAQDITERKERRRGVEESERRYRTLVENFPNGAVGLFDEDLRYTAVGGQLFEHLDFDPEDRLGRSIHDLHSPDLLDEIEPYFHAALEGEANEFEVEFYDRYLHANTLPIEGSHGEVDAGMLVIQDVTERREAQRELRESEAKFRMLAENLEEIVWMADADAEEYIYINPAFEDVWGLDRQRLYGEPLSFLDAVHPEDRDRVHDAFAALPEYEFDEEFRVVRPDGEIRWVYARGARVHDEQEGMTRVVGIGEDITERKERERQLEESERLYRTLAENFPNGAVGIYDHDLRCDLVEGAMWDDVDTDAEDLEGNTIFEAFSEEVVEDIEPVFREAIERGTTDSVITEFEGRTLRVWATPLRDPSGEIFGGLSFAQDITDRKQREAELERALDLLHKTERIADVGGWEIDVDTMDVFWTDHIFEVLGVDADEEPPLDEALDMYHEADQPRVEEAVQAGLEEGEPFELEARIRTESDDYRWLRLQGVPEIRDGEVVTLRGTALDVTERREREQFLREMQEIAADSDREFDAKLQAMLDLGCERFDMELGGLVTVDPSTGRYEVDTTNGDHEYLRPGEQYPISETYCRQPIEERDTCTITDHEGYEDDLCYEQFGMESYLGTHLELDGAADRTFWFVSSDPREDGFSETDRRLHQQMGQWIRYELEHQHNADQLAAVNRLNAVARDINRELAQQSTRESIETVVCERLTESESYEFAWIGTTEEGEAVVPSTTATTPGSPDGVDQEWQTELTETALRSGELQVRRDADRAPDESDQQTRQGVNSVAAIPIAYEDQTYGALTVYSERSNAFDGEERAVVNQLGEIVGLAMAAVEREQQLEYERERLEFVNRLLRHNLLNGLNAIRAQATLLETRVQDDGERFVETIRERVDDMADLIETMRSLMTIITDEQQELQKIDLESVLRNELEKVRKIHRDAEFRLDGDLDEIDAVRANGVLSEVFENLLVNAVQHNDAETPEISVSVECDADGVTVNVADNGPGVPDELKNRIFEKGEKNFDSPGTGFGLYLAREIVEGCGGTISVDDNDPTGAVFSVALDRA